MPRKWGSSLDGEYDWNLFSNWKGFVGATRSYVGTRSTDFGSSAAVPPATPTQVDLPSYETLGARRSGLPTIATVSRSMARI